MKPGGWRGIPLLAIALAAADTTAVARTDQRALNVHQRMMDALGGEALEKVVTLGFDFVVQEGGEEKVRRSHVWDRTTGQYRVTMPAAGRTCTVYLDLDAPERGTAVCGQGVLEGEESGRALERAYGAFINDTYWLLMPFKWRDPGVRLTYIGPERSGKTRWDVVLLEFAPGTGLTSGDRYWAYVDRRTGRMDKWEMLPQGRDGPPEPVLWTGWEEHGGITLSTRREIPGSDRLVLLDNLLVSRERFPERFRPTVEGAAGARPRPRAPGPPAVKAVPTPEAGPVGTAAPAPAGTVAREQAEPEEGAVPAPRGGGGGILVVLSKGDSTALLVDPDTFEILERIPTGDGPREAVVDPAGRRAYVSNYGHSTAGRSITVVDLESRKVVETWDLSPHSRPHGLAFDPEGRLWVTVEGSRAVLQLDPARGGEVLRVAETGEEVSHMVAISHAAGKAFVANIGSGTVTVVPLGGGDPRQVEVGRGPEGIDVSPRGDEVWVANRYEDQLVVLDAETETVVARVPAGDFPMRVRFTPDGSRVLVSHVRGGEVWVYDARTRERLSILAGGAAPIGILVSPAGDRVFVADTRDNRVRILDLESGRLLGEVEAGTQPEGMAWVPRR